MGRRLPTRRPKAFRSFPALEVGGRHAPATGGDIRLHTTARRADLCFELALCLRRELGDAAEAIEEVHGFRYLDVRDLTRWEQLAVREQEAAIGRRKRDSRELADRVKPATAHIARVVIEEDGREFEIVRHSFPYGTTSECGLFFIAFTRDLAIPEKMLRRMMGASGDGLHDRLMEFTRAVSGATFFAPSLAGLRALGTR